MTYRELLQSAEEVLTAANVPDAKTDAWRLFEELLNMSRGSYFMKQDEEIPGALQMTVTAFEEAVSKRKKRIPLQYILGTQDFYGRTFKVSEDTLIPRFDTEVVVEKAIDAAKEYCRDTGKQTKDLKILDVCTGTGCILISMVCELQASEGIGTDISEGAVTLAKTNAESNNVTNCTKFCSGDLFNALNGTDYEKTEFDIVVSNPPYIKSSDIQTLDEEVRMHEPMTALDGSEDGLLFYRRIAEEIKGHIAHKGRLVFEIGCDEARDVANIMQDAGFIDIKIHKDLAGLDRAVTGTYGGTHV